MERRNALKILGTMMACIVGSRSMTGVAETSTYLPGFDHTEDSAPISELTITPQKDFVFSEGGIRNIVIRRKDKSVVSIPFSEIIDALVAK